MELKIINDQGESTSSVSASDTAFGREYNESLIHQVVTAFMANARQGTRAQKDRSEVRHSTKKPWAQKGTGRARAGMTSSPLWRGGGRIFPNRPDENFSHKLNRKMFRAGLSSIFSQLAREDRLSVVETFTLDAPKTKLLAQKLKNMGFAENVLIITEAMDENLGLASRNLPFVNIVSVAGADPVSLIRHDKVIVTRGAVAKIEEMFA